ncbi:MAG TPA: type II toxin-antitoxin system VapC family toxin [Sporichthyaceae bacterium]|nr:type II toxin-antitoxin system VapC family toxin [Sporichthyaceae bacterium]
MIADPSALVAIVFRERGFESILATWEAPRTVPAGIGALGDCFSYATARLARQPLLFVGDDFTHTDLDAA